MSASQLVSLDLEATNISADFKDLLKPDSDLWNKVAGTKISLVPTPLDRQPSAYIQAAWAEKDHGDTSEVEVRTVRTEDSLLLRLSWACEDPVHLINDINVYTDACAVLFIGSQKESDQEDTDYMEELISTMGSLEHPVSAWHWRAGEQVPFLISAKGIGTVERLTEHEVAGASRWINGEWQVVFGKPFTNTEFSTSSNGEISLVQGEKLFLSFAVWSGAKSERAGIKSYSPVCHRLMFNQ